ncbi:MAG: hypothetical protein JW809_20195 [Pirellulales bacterium]|nr:hypothetical protein [Pirellulales bacterium]
MWRSFFLAVGVSLCIMGVECLGVERVVLKIHEPTPRPTGDFLNSSPAGPGPQRVIVPPDYAPWSLLGLGAVIILYAYDLPRRVSA